MEARAAHRQEAGGQDGAVSEGNLHDLHHATETATSFEITLPYPCLSLLQDPWIAGDLLDGRAYRPG